MNAATSKMLNNSNLLNTQQLVTSNTAMRVGACTLTCVTYHLGLLSVDLHEI